MKKKLNNPEHSRFQKLLGLTWLFLGFFLAVALLSFHPTDPSLLTTTWHYVHPSQETIANAAGWLGAQIAAPLFYVFGDLAFLFSFLFILRGIQSFASPGFTYSSWFIFTNSILIVTLSALLSSLSWPQFEPGMWAGLISMYVKIWMGDVGGTIFLCFLFLVMSNLSLRFRLKRTPRVFTFFVHGIGKFTKSCVSILTWFQLARRWFFQKSLYLIKSTLRPLGIIGEQYLNRRRLKHLEKKSARRWDLGNSLELAKTQTPVTQTQRSKTLNNSTPYMAPPSTLFRQSLPHSRSLNEKKDIEELKQKIVQTFSEFGISGSIVDVQPGPVVTVYCFRAQAGTKLSKILGLSEDLALALRLDSLMIQPMTGTNSLGIQVPNPKRQNVLFGDLVQNTTFQDRPEPLLLALGCSLDGNPQYADLSAMPRLLVAGATGSGKSVAIHSFLCSLILRKKPEDVKFILVDPKMLELSVYEAIPHLMLPVITEANKAAASLRWAIHEMERRYQLMQTARVRDISGYNRSVGSKDDDEKLPYIVIVIDELADLMLVSPKEVETSIQRLAQKARACGIHLILATQRPSVDVITGVIKANLPCRISFQVVSKHDSRTILDAMGAEKLLGKGDCLWNKPGGMKLERLQGALILDEEVNELVTHLKKQYPGQKHDEKVAAWIDSHQESDINIAGVIESDIDEKFEQAVEIAHHQGAISASYLQRQLKIGYNRAARIVEAMDERGWLAAADGVKARKWLGPQQ